MLGGNGARSLGVTWICMLTLVLGAAGSAYASGMPVTANLIEVTATAGDVTATFSEVFPAGRFNGVHAWNLHAPVDLTHGPKQLGRIDSLNVSFDADPEVMLDFSLTNTSLTDDVLYNITTATIVFDGVPNAVAEASSSITLTQGAGSPAGASITGLLQHE
jgi:hypothetical protein